MSITIVVLDGYTLNPGDLSWEPLEVLGDVTVYDRTAPEQVVARARNASFVLTNKVPLDADTLAQLSALRYIGVLATGYDVVDVEAARQHSVTVTNIPSYGTNSVAQMVIAHLLAFCHHVQDHNAAVKAGKWTAAPDFCFWDFPQIELDGKMMGIVGFGRIGQQVGRIVAALGMAVQAYDHRPHEVTDIEGFRWVELPTLFRTSDVISLNCPLTPETEGMINSETLALMKPSAFLINAARGGLVVEHDLAAALNEGRIAGAGLDVLSTEPPEATNPLLTARNTFITPHIAWATREARQRLMRIAAANISAFLDGHPQNVVGQSD